MPRESLYFWNKLEIEEQCLLPAAVTKPRYHQVPYLRFVTDGALRVQADNRTAMVRRGEMLWQAPGIFIGLEALAPTTYYTVRFRPAVWAANAEADREALGIMQQFNRLTGAGLIPLPITAATRDQALRQCQCLLASYLRPEREYYRCDLKAQAMLLLCTLIDDHKLQQQIAATTNLNQQHEARERLGPALDKLNRRLFIANPDLKIESLAHECGYQMSQFHKLFVQATNVTPHRYLTERRIAHACTLLAEPKRRILDVAFDSGFHSQSRFYAAFKDITGTTPRRYRQQQRQRDEEDREE